MLDDFEIVNFADRQAGHSLYFELPLGEVDFQSTFQGRHIDKVKVLWTGQIDAIIRRFDVLRVMDHKTTTMLGANFFAEFMNSSPAMGYTWAAQHILGDKVAGLFLNAIALRRPSKAGVQFKVQRRSYDYDAERLAEWQYNTLTLVSDFLSHLDRGFFPMEYRWCVGKYGACKYLDVCSMPPAQRERRAAWEHFRECTGNPKRENQANTPTYLKP